MNDRFCPDCDTYLTRAAVLSMRLRKMAVQMHTDAKHAGQRVDDCSLEPCVTTMRVMKENTE